MTNETSSTVEPKFSFDGPPGVPSVVVPKGFTNPSTALEVVPLSFHLDGYDETFLVAASIVDDPQLLALFQDSVLKAYLKYVPNRPFDVIDLKDFRSVGIYTVDQMEQAVEKLDNCTYLLQDRIPKQSVSIMAGDSGIGKSPFCYELAICIAAGVPFLGIPTVLGRVLYLDYEDDTKLMISYAKKIAGKLGLSEIPDNFRLWSPALVQDGADPDPLALIEQFHPDFVVIDTISTAFSEAETENRLATDLFNKCRATGAAVLFTHHLKKDSSSDDSSFDLDLNRETTVKDFLAVRGAGALVNTAYLRMKLIRAKSNDEDLAFIVRSYRRGKGGLPTLSVARVLDENGEPIGHCRLGGIDKLVPQYREAYVALPDRFQFKDLDQHFKGGGSKQNFLRACESQKLISSKRDGTYYVKLKE